MHFVADMGGAQFDEPIAACQFYLKNLWRTKSYLWFDCGNFEQVLDLGNVEVGDTDEASFALVSSITWSDELLHRLPRWDDIVFWLAVRGTNWEVHNGHVEVVQTKLLQVHLVTRLDLVSMSTIC